MTWKLILVSLLHIMKAKLKTPTAKYTRNPHNRFSTWSSGMPDNGHILLRAFVSSILFIYIYLSKGYIAFGIYFLFAIRAKIGMPSIVNIAQLFNSPNEFKFTLTNELPFQFMTGHLDRLKTLGYG